MSATWNEPSFLTGSTGRCSASITDIEGALVNPGTLTFSVGCQGQTATTYTWTNPSGDPTNNIFNDGTGLFYVDFEWPSAGLWAYKWSAQPSGNTDPTGTSAIIDGEVQVSDPLI